MTLRLNPLQLRMVDAVLGDVPRIGVRAGWGSGKTFGLGLCLKLMCLARPASSVLWVTDTGPRLGAVVEPVCQELLGADGWRWHGDPRQRFWEAPNKSRLWLRAYFRASTRMSHQNPLEGINATGGAIDEAQVFPDSEVLRILTGRCRTPGHTPIIIVAGLPVAGAWWEGAVQRAGGRCLYGTSYDNAANLADGWFEQARATLSPAEYESLIENKPRLSVGQVLDNWSDAEWPEGNILSGWTAPSECRIAVDFGRRSPADIFLAHDQTRGIDVAFADVCPDECLVPDLVRRVQAEADRRGVRIVSGAGDPAGRATNDQTGVDSIDLLARPRPEGLGVRLRYETDPVRRHIPAGILRLRRRICGPDGRRTLAMTRELWEAGLNAPGRSLAKSILGYRYPQGGGDEPVKDGLHDHHCFVAGTLVETPHGPVPIETMRPGDAVCTRSGVGTVTCAAQTGSRHAWTMTTSTGRVLVGTPEHPIFVHKVGWRRFDATRYCDILVACSNLTTATLKLSSTAGGHSDDTQTRRAEGTACTSQVRAGMESRSTCTGSSGRTTTGPFRGDTSFTTGTETLATTRSTTSQQSRLASTVLTMPTTTTRTRATRKATVSILNESGRSRQCGTGLKRARRGMLSMGSSHGPIGTRPSAHASGAEQRMQQGTAGGQDSAQTTARPSLGAHLALTTSSAPASTAGARSRRTSTTGFDSAVERVVSVLPKEGPAVPVFNLTVEPQHEYFANGILVSNCDALRYDSIVHFWYDHPMDGRMPSLDLHQPAPQRPAWRSY